MLIELSIATPSDKPILRQMLELCQYDASETDGSDLDLHGCFGYAYLDHYWVESGRHPFLVRADGRLAGFVLVNGHVYLAGSERAIAEFFVMRKYRRRGVGKTAAFQIFDRFRGRWEIRQTATNLAAQVFWRKIITDYTAGQYHEIILHDERWQGPVQFFDNAPN